MQSSDMVQQNYCSEKGGSAVLPKAQQAYRMHKYLMTDGAVLLLCRHPSMSLQPQVRSSLHL